MPDRSNTTPGSPSKGKDALLEGALRQILKPVAHAMIRFGLPLPTAVRILKEALVETAETKFGSDGKAPTDSRVSVLTGVHRKDVKTIRAEGRTPEEKARNSLLATVVARWMGDTAYQDRDGKPRPLMRGTTGNGPEFNALVESVARDVRPKTVLDGLVTQGLAEIDEDRDCVRLLTDSFLPGADTEELFRFFRNNLHDHMAAATHNLMTDTPEDRFLERAVFYTHLTPASVEDLRKQVGRAANAALQSINTSALERQARDAESPDATHRFRYGMFFYSEDESHNNNNNTTPERPDGEDA
ncbi:MAG: DUF6502 family protein [Pseudomonadota bacterium]